jgi:hypothetical protein
LARFMTSSALPRWTLLRDQDLAAAGFGQAA